MMKVKKTFYVAAIMISLFLFYSCTPKPDTICDSTESNIYSISFVWIDEDGNIKTLRKLPSSDVSTFMQSFSQIPFDLYWNDPPNEIYGSTIKLELRDGSYYLLNHYCTAYYLDGKIDYSRQYYDNESFEALWLKYCDDPYNHD